MTAQEYSDAIKSLNAEDRKLLRALLKELKQIRLEKEQQGYPLEELDTPLYPRV